MSDKGQRVRDPEGTRTAIIDAAERLFAENGFAATSMRDISNASGVSHPLIHHHFGSKEELYTAVKRRLVEGYAKQFPRAARAVNRPIGVRAEMRRLLAFLGDNPMLLRLCLRTRLEGDNQVWPGEPDQLDTMRRRIEVSQKRGLIRADLDATYLSIMILGLVCFWSGEPRALRPSLRRGISTCGLISARPSPWSSGVWPQAPTIRQP